jgi:SAM-dependent methyltransferase
MTLHNDNLVSALLELASDFLARQSTSAISSGGQSISTPFSTTSQSDWAEGVWLWNENGRHLIADLPGRDCPACGHQEHRHLFQSYDGYPYVECLSCGCWYVPLKVEAELFERFFEYCPQAFEVTQRNLKGRQSETSKQSNLERIGGYLDTLVPMLKSTDSIRYLDMGCGLGYSLHAGRTRGFQALGVESSRECIALAVQDGLEVFHVSDKVWQDQQFHLISFWESLEHMVDPVTVLQECSRRLAPHGLLAFSVPNQNSPLVRTLREDCSFINGGYDSPGHINLFNPVTIERLLERSGYKLLALDGQYSLNLAELVSYLLGKHRGAYAMLQSQIIHNDLSEETNALLGAIGPAAALLERVTLIAPILFGFACRKDNADYFSNASERYHKMRYEQLLAQIHRLEPASSNVAVLEQKLSVASGNAAVLEQKLSVASGNAAVLEQKLSVATEHIEHIEDQLLLARNPLRRLARFVRGKFNPPKG